MVITDQRITVAQFEALIALSENAQRRLELLNGRIHEEMTTEEHSIIAANLYDALREWAKQGRFGRVLFEVYHRAPDDDFTVVIPDVEFTRQERLLEVTRQGAVPQMPDLAIEVKSPGNTFIQLREKALYYLKHGASEVWLVFPEKQSIEVHTLEVIRTYASADTLASPDLLPDFTLAVSAVFSD